MRFDPQAGFTPVEEASPTMEAPSSPPPRPRAAKLFLAWVVVGGIGLFIWQVLLPNFAPRLVKAVSTPMEQEREVDERSAMSSRLARALEMVAQGDRSDDPPESPRDKAAGAATVDDAWMEADPGLRRTLRDAEAQEAHRAMTLAEEMMSRGKYGDARSLLRRVLDFAPHDAQVRYKLGLACVMERDFAGARAELAELRELDPSLASLLSNLVPKS